MAGIPTLQISIPDPCKQDWTSLPNAGAGKYCDACSKTVTDFSLMSDAMLLAHIKRNGLGCGLFRQDQLNRPLIQTKEPPRKYAYRWFAALFILLGCTDDSCAQTKSQANVVLNDQPNSTDSLKAPVHSPMDIAHMADQPYQQKNGGEVALGGGEMSPHTIYIVDGVIVSRDGLPVKRNFWRRLRFWRNNRLR